MSEVLETRQNWQTAFLAHPWRRRSAPFTKWAATAWHGKVLDSSSHGADSAMYKHTHTSTHTRSER